MSTLDEVLLNVRAADALDVLILSVVIFLVWRWLQKRAARSVSIALASLGAVYVLSRALSMYLTVAVFQAGLAVMLFALVVIFQDDLRHGFERLSAWRPFDRRTPDAPGKTFIDTLVESVMLLSSERIGALIVLPGRQPLERHLRGGIGLDGLLSIELLHSIFHSGSRGHDGGVIIRNGRVNALSVHLPLSENLAVVGNRGTRHAAALGLAERTDALVIVVSEERGSVTLARGSLLIEVDSAAELERHLRAFFETESTSPVPPQTLGDRLNVLGAQLGSLTIATVLWFVFAFRIETVQRTIEEVPVEFRNLPAARTLADAEPQTVEVTLVGPERAFDALDQDLLKVSVDLAGVRVDQATTPIRAEHLHLPEGISLREADPPTLHYRLGRLTILDLPVHVTTRGHLPEGWTLLGIRTDPEILSVRVAPHRRDQYDHLSTEPINLDDIRATTTVTAHVHLPQGFELANPQDAEVSVHLEVRRDAPPASTPRGNTPNRDG